ncbi:Uncharacterised protein [Yersinia intermedia]|uniref:Uncharacterized protein n=1 Tax=Yersinia intermedia TaxID=631 RepID=A0A0T9N620_YERIN|nr:Uncharacterised protein [Yersinia intermedia]
MIPVCAITPPRLETDWALSVTLSAIRLALSARSRAVVLADSCVAAFTTASVKVISPDLATKLMALA